MTSLNTLSNTQSNAALWTQSQDDLLRATYTKPWKELYVLFPNRTYASLSQHMAKLGLKRPKGQSRRSWSKEDIAYLHANYGKVSHTVLSERLKRKEHTITEYARRQGLKMVKDENGRTSNTIGNATLRPLLEGGLQGYYWMGYLMADGYMHHGLKQVVLVSAEADKDHMATYAAFLQAECHRYMSLDGFFPNRPKRPHYRVSVADTLHATKLIELYDWKPRKTYNPPSSQVLTKTLSNPDHFLSFLIGFIDGDGHINKTFGIRVENHASWITFHDFLLDTLRHLGILDIATAAKVNKAGYSDFSLPKRLTQTLKRFINQHQLVVLTRKWDKVIT